MTDVAIFKLRADIDEDGRRVFLEKIVSLDWVKGLYQGRLPLPLK